MPLRRDGYSSELSMMTESIATVSLEDCLIDP